MRREQKLIYSIVIRIGRRIAADARNASNLFVTVGLIQVRHDDPVPTALLFKSYLPGAIFDHNNGIDKTVSSCKMHEDRSFFLPLQWRRLRKSHTWNFALLFWKRVTLPRVWKTLGSHCHFLRDSTKPRLNYVQLPFRFCSISFSSDSLSFIGPISVERQTGGSNAGTAVNAILIKRRRISQ